MATRQDEPALGCKATKEGLLESKKNLDETDDCPVCERRGVLCEVSNHPSRPLLPSTGKKVAQILVLPISIFW